VPARGDFCPISSQDRKLDPLLAGVEHARVLTFSDWEEQSRGDSMHKLILVWSGQVILEGPAGRWSILPKHLLFLPASRPYIFRANRDTRLTLVYLDPEQTDWPHEGCWVTGSSPLAVEMVLHASSWSPETARDSEQARAFLRAISHLCRDWFAKPRILWLPTARSAMMRQVIDRAIRDLGRATVTSLACSAGVSVSTLQRHCKHELGMSWRAFLNELRMTLAMEMLVSSDRSIADISAAIGFRSVGSFTSAFTRRLAIGPRDFARTYKTGVAFRSDSR
jgi:AraC-like DNA-binding protein